MMLNIFQNEEILVPALPASSQPYLPSLYLISIFHPFRVFSWRIIISLRFNSTFFFISWISLFCKMLNRKYVNFFFLSYCACQCGRWVGRPTISNGKLARLELLIQWYICEIEMSSWNTPIKITWFLAGVTSYVQHTTVAFGDQGLQM